MNMKVIVTCNGGSSNFKLGIFEADTLKPVARRKFANFNAAKHWLEQQSYTITAISHRIVHGGDRFRKPVRITPRILTTLEKLVPLAPLHQPQEIAIIRAMQKAYPKIINIACFDTSFHQTQHPLERLFGLPRRYAKKGIKRYGFHGISYQYIAQKLPRLMGKKVAKGKIIVAHLGGGSSMCAMEKLKSKASTMGLSTLEGLMMGTRCGSLDPGVPLYLMQQEGMRAKKIEHLLYWESGLKGLSGISSNMDELEASPTREAKEAIALYCYMAAKHLGALITTLGGLEALVFTGGIGQHSALIRKKICAYLVWMGLRLDTAKNRQNATQISSANSRIAVYTLPTDEELMLAKACQAFISQA